MNESDSSYKILDQFSSEENNYNQLENRVRFLLNSLIDIENNKNIHNLTSRIKKADKIKDKIYRKNNKYSNIKDITDIVGYRIITFFDDEIDRISSIIEKEFVIDYENSIDKRKVDFDKFGYQSLHYIVTLSDDRLKLKEYSSFKDIRFEIQIRTILQHSWAEIEHKLGYKNKISIPDNSKRAFSRIAALLEMADVEFLRLRESINIYVESLPNLIENTPKTVRLDQESLKVFIEEDKNYKKLETNIALKLNFTIEAEVNNLTWFIERLIILNILTINDLQEFVENEFNQLLEYSSFFRDGDGLQRDEQGRGKAIKGFFMYEIVSYISIKENKATEMYGDGMEKLIEAFKKIENKYRS